MANFLLYPLSWLYGFGASIRNQMYDLNLLKSREFDVPVISIGNITVGGTGKTPHVEYLIELLKNEFQIATLSRGYKRKTASFQIADEESSVDQIGDEPRQLKQKYPELTVVVDRKRVNGIEKLLKLERKTDVILLDDAFPAVMRNSFSANTDNDTSIKHNSS